MNITNELWLDIQLTKKTINYLWDNINTSPTQPSHSSVGGVEKNKYLQDKDNWFYENVLKQFAEKLYFKEWNNYYNVYIAKVSPHPEFTLTEMWVNFMKQHEFNPPHAHIAEYAFVIFMKIPTHWKDQHASHPHLATNHSASDFQFLLGEPRGTLNVFNIPLSPKDEGRMLFFPAWLYHQVFPFYNTEEERVTIAGNIKL